jgi:hypothetical protein
MQEQPCSQFDLHLHDQQPTSKYFSNYYSYLMIRFLQPYNMPLYRLYSRKNPKEMVPKNGYRSMQIIGYKSMNLGILLQSTTKSYYPSTQSTFIRSSVGCHMPCLSTSCWLTSSTCCRCLYHVEPPRPLTSTLPGRLTSTFDLLSIHLDFTCVSSLEVTGSNPEGGRVIIIILLFLF